MPVASWRGHGPHVVRCIMAMQTGQNSAVVDGVSFPVIGMAKFPVRRYQNKKSGRGGGRCDGGKGPGAGGFADGDVLAPVKCGHHFGARACFMRAS
ncbi:MAG: hypothetical protein CM15mP46_2810 [Alphaproteobacteria bacterium]|nr:MAG: hypothetical protein CM15mP46_2810 [Alphaproteobacteria bacterium]